MANLGYLGECNVGDKVEVKVKNVTQEYFIMGYINQINPSYIGISNVSTFKGNSDIPERKVFLPLEDILRISQLQKRFFYK